MAMTAEHFLVQFQFSGALDETLILQFFDDLPTRLRLVR